MNIGIRAHDFGKQPLEQLADRISMAEFSSIHLALGKAIEGLNSNLGCLSPGMAYHIRKAFEKRNIQIAVLGCYINTVDPNKDARQRQLDRFKEHIRYVRSFGCDIVATETGSMNGDMSFTPDNHGEEAFNIMCESTAELVKEAEKFGVLVCIEGAKNHTINTPQRVKRLIDSVKSNNLQVLFDPVNFITIDNYKKQEDIINESFELFGDRIAVMHAKDFIVEGASIKNVPAGKGMLNYKLIAKYIKNNKQYINVLLEDIRVEDMNESHKFLRDVYNNA